MSLSLSLAVFKLQLNLFIVLPFPVLEYSYGGRFLLKFLLFNFLNIFGVVILKSICVSSVNWISYWSIPIAYCFLCI